MESASFLYGRPTWAIALVLFVLIFAAGEAGHRLGRRKRDPGNGPKKEHVTTIQILATALIALLISLVVFVIMDLDRPYRGVIRVNQTAMEETRADMDALAPLP